MASSLNTFLNSLIGVGFVTGGPAAVASLGIVCPRAARLSVGRFRHQH